MMKSEDEGDERGTGAAGAVACLFAVEASMVLAEASLRLEDSERRTGRLFRGVQRSVFANMKEFKSVAAASSSAWPARYLI
jgi:hypothetical protein